MIIHSNGTRGKEEELDLGSRQQCGEDGKCKFKFDNVINPPVVAIFSDGDDDDTYCFIIVFV